MPGEPVEPRPSTGSGRISGSGHSDGRLRAFSTRHQMALFVVLTLLISWAFVIPADGGLIPYGPMIAAFIVLAVVAGRRGVTGLWAQMIRWRVGWKWYVIAPGVLIAVHLCALGINLALGAEIVSTAHLASLPTYLSAIVVPLLLLGGQWEEPGWMGYAQRHYQERFVHKVLVATLVVGLMRIVWHAATGLRHHPLVRLPLRNIRAAGDLHLALQRIRGERTDRHDRPSVLQCHDRHSETIVWANSPGTVLADHDSG
jgi:hypothetical protein